MCKKWLKSNWKRLLVIIVCLALVVVHSIWSQLKFDSINIWLVAIAAVLFLIPSPSVFTPYLQRLKRIKAWQFEAELNELENKVEKAEETLANTPDLEVSKNVSPEVEEVLKEASKDPRAALLLLSSKIDTTVRNRLEEEYFKSGIAVGRNHSTARAIEMGIERGIFPSTALSAYKDFRGIRNEIAHDYGFKVDTDTIFSLISLGTQLLKVLSTEKPGDK